jgi:hypothetical protein
MKKLYEQRLKWRPHDKKFPTWSFFCVNDEPLVDVKVPSVMIVCMASYMTAGYG